MIHEFQIPIPCTTPLGDALIWYVKPNGFLENDELTCIMLDGGIIKHFTTAQVRIWHNETYEIKKKSNESKES